MPKERIRTSDIAKNSKYPHMKDLCVEDWEGFSVVQFIEKDFDSEKGFVDYEIVIQRHSDDKYFKFTYTEFGNNGNDADEQVAIEVFPKEKIIIVYE